MRREGARASDEKLRLAALNTPPDRKKKERPPEAHWMHGMRMCDEPTGTQSVKPLERLRIYQQHLGTLGHNVHTCPNCLQRAHDHGTRLAHECCWYCKYNPRVLDWRNGLDLNLECAEDEQSDQARNASQVEPSVPACLLVSHWLPPAIAGSTSHLRNQTDRCLGKLASNGRIYAPGTAS